MIPGPAGGRIPPPPALALQRMSQKPPLITRETWRIFSRAVASFRKSAQGRWGLLLFAVLIAFLFAINGLNVLNSYVGRDFISAIEHKDYGQFVTQAWLFAGVFALSTLTAVMYRFVEERLGLLWRDWQTRQALEAYLDRRVYYHLEDGHHLENPDQRIAEDIKTFTTTTLSFVLMVLNGCFTVVAFSGVLWSISPRLFVVAVSYASLGTVFTVLLGRRLVGLNNKQLDREADFRSELLHVRENAESVALLHREGRLRARLLRRLDDLVLNFRHIIAVNRNVGFFTTGYNYLIQLIPALVVAPFFIRGQIEFGVVTQSAMAFAQLMGAFSLIVTQFQSISSYAAVIGRLGRMVEAIESARCVTDPPVRIVEDAGRVVFEHLTLHGPGGACLVRDLNVTIERGTRVLVTGKPGHAKIALFKATAGLHSAGAGIIRRPSADQILFLPERPYLPKGALRELLLRTTQNGHVSDDEILEVLRLLKADRIVAEAGGLNGERDWNDVLGLGEQAAVAVARVLLAGPEFVFLDRMSVAMDTTHADQVLKLFTQRGITYLVLGKPEDQLGNFDAALTLAADGSWTWRTVAG